MYHPDTIEHMARTKPWIMRRIIETYTNKWEWVLDPMCGVGTTLVEALLMDRHVLGIELEEKFGHVALKNGEHISNQMRLDGKGWPHWDVLQGYAQEVLLDLINEERMFELVTFSPPYEGISYTYRSASGRWKNDPDECRGFDTDKIEASDRQVKRYYSENPLNIANLKNSDYWNAMSCIYAKLWEVGKTMVVVVKNQIKNHQERDFAQETIDHVVAGGGWKFKCAHLAMLGEPSHWENVRRKRYPNTPKIDWEHCLVFKR